MALAAVSRLFGREFYRLRPDILFFCIPAYLIIAGFRLQLYAYQDKYTNHAYNRVLAQNQKSKQKWFLNFEKNIYLLIYFISDIISCFELSSILAVSLFNLNLMYVYTAFFPFSIFFALFIHTQYRVPELNINYNKFEKIMWNIDVKAPISTSIASITTFFCLIASMAIFEASPLAAVSLSILAFLFFYKYLKENRYSLYSLFLFDFAISKLISFKDLLIQHLKIFHLTAELPVITTCSSISIYSLAFLYSVAYFYSTERDAYIKQQYDIKPINNDPYPTKTYS